jgi:hypothetical protein
MAMICESACGSWTGSRMPPHFRHAAGICALFGDAARDRACWWLHRNLPVVHPPAATTPASRSCPWPRMLFNC